ncbi:SPFH domain-containing protein [Carboxylicivirga mesophila]|uniref:SPFH domain-containing protein n=1 Tax=Carboxylicivirga mesophila TaxID=1166478 RepID=A0ABS5K6M0_9BACT|nr:SPFH domain-containing protein [Carboxylicivirga mesophila]MBS2210592.1 SPFH domain-containing protein [Carboxylicivirga mesophila]
MKTEKTTKPQSGYTMLIVFLMLLATTLATIIKLELYPLIIAIPFILAILPGFFIVNPNGSKVLVLFGAYKGTVKDNGFFWANPFYTKTRISLRARNFDSDKVKVNDKIGNPILINVILVWKVKDTYKAAFEVDHYEEFVRVQTDAAVRKLAGSYPYDNFDDEQAEVTLRSGMHEVNEALEQEITERLAIAGIEVTEARIGYLAYAPEIAGSMLKRQQAVAIVAARKKIVEGAVGMVEDALTRLSEDEIIEFDEHQKASMVSNLMVVLCGDKEATPVINTGTLHN